MLLINCVSVCVFNVIEILINFYCVLDFWAELYEIVVFWASVFSLLLSLKNLVFPVI